MKTTDCKYCKIFKSESKELVISEVLIGDDQWSDCDCPLYFCPNCGKRVKEVAKTCSDCVHKGGFGFCYYGRVCYAWEGY